MIKQLVALLSLLVVLIVCGCTEKQATVSSTDQLPSQYILLNRSATLTNYIGEYSEADAGKTFLLINMTIENHGYKTFNINPNYFGVAINKVAYPYDKATYSTKSPLTSLTLLDGGKTTGHLVFQIPEDETRYVLGYIGPGDYNFIYGNLIDNSAKSVVEQEPKLPIRNVTYNLGPDTQATSSDTVTSSQGIVTQTTRIDAGDNGYADIVIETFQGSADTNQLINDVLKLGKIKDFNVYEKGVYDATLVNGDKITVHIRECALFTTHGGKISVAAFSPDKSTVVAVTSSLDRYRTDALLGSLKIGPMLQTT